MDNRGRAATIIFALFLSAGLLLAAIPTEAGTPAPLPVQIPIRDINEPPSSLQTAAPYAPAWPQKRHSRRKSVKRRHRTTAKRNTRTARQAPARTAPAPAPASANRAPQLEQRREAPTESIMPLEPLPAPAPAPSATPAPTPAPTPPAGPAAATPPPAQSTGQATQATFPPAPEPAGQAAQPPATPAKP